jgi:hypothetical protein
MKKSIAIVFTLAAILFCGVPGVLIFAGKLDEKYFTGPETATICGGILILLPLVIAIASFSNIDGGMKDVLTTGCMTIMVLTLLSPLIGFLIFGAVTEGWPAIQRFAWQKQHQTLQTELGVVCKGTGVPSSAEYESGTGIHPIVLFNQDGEADRLSSDVPANWLPTDVSSAEIVACIERSEKLIETCRYEGGIVTRRYQLQLVVHLFAAHTGDEIDSQVFLGTMPDECPAAKVNPDPTRYGSSVSFSEIQPWLAQIIQE